VKNRCISPLRASQQPQQNKAFAHSGGYGDTETLVVAHTGEKTDIPASKSIDDVTDITSIIYIILSSSTAEA